MESYHTYFEHYLHHYVPGLPAMLKHRLVRERPYIGLIGIDCAMPPLDRYSFPSGYTLHSVGFTT